jgi:7,8-dihydro-6-hydroxymethylpterin dimethyltransferase
MDEVHSATFDSAVEAALPATVETAAPGGAAGELERYKVSLRRYSPVQKGLGGLPWPGQWECGRCGEVTPGRLLHQPSDDSVVLEHDCPRCGTWREPHTDVLFTPARVAGHPHQPRETFSGAPIRPIPRALPRTVETLCPECSCLILGRSYERDGAVWMEKTCPEHGYFRDKVTSDARLWLLCEERCFQDERGVEAEQARPAVACPTDCGICAQHHSNSCLAQIDLSNRCNLTCPVCFASANQAGYLTEPSFEEVAGMLRVLREQKPVPAAAVQFTGGEPTLHPEFLRILTAARDMGFTHVQCASNGVTLAEPGFAEKAAAAGLQTVYLQFDGTDDAIYRKLRGTPLLETKRAAVEACRRAGIRICLVPTLVKGVNEDQVGPIFRFAVENSDVINAIAYQPVAFTGRIARHELEAKRYTLGDLAAAIARETGADVQEDFFPASLVTPVSRFLQVLDGKPKIRLSCHADCGIGTYFFLTPEGETVPIPRMFDLMRLFDGLNDLAAEIEGRGPGARPTRGDLARAGWLFFRSYRWRNMRRSITPWGFVRALRSMTDKGYGRGERGKKAYRTIMTGGMHFMDRYNYDTERVRRCVIQYSTPDGLYPFCTINSGPTYRPYIEALHARPLA